MYKKTMLPLILHLAIALCFSVSGQTNGTGQPPSDLQTKAAELDKQIEEQNALNRAIAEKTRQVRTDSAAAVLDAEKKISALARAIADMQGAIRQSSNTLSVLQQSHASFTSVVTEKETGLKAAATRSKAAIQSFNGEITTNKQALVTAKKTYERARADSVALAKKVNQEMSLVRDSLNRVDKSLAEAKRLADNLSAKIKTIEKDSALADKTGSDTLKAVSGRLLGLRASIAKTDSVLKQATEEYHTLRKDSIDLFTRYQQGTRNQAVDGKRLDSLSLALQSSKITLFNFQEKLRLDSAILTLTAEMRELQKGGATSEKIEEKQQQIETNKTKRDALLRDGSVAAVASDFANKKPEEVAARINEKLAAIQRSLDSTALVREKAIRELVFLEKEFKEKSKEHAKYGRKLSELITVSSRQLINEKARVPKLEQDSIAVFKKRRVLIDSLKNGKLPLVASLQKAVANRDELARKREALSAHIAQRDSLHQKTIDAANATVRSAFDGQKNAQTALDTSTARQQKARDDSAAVAKDISEKKTQALLSMEMKQEELTVKNGQHEKLLSELKQAQADSAAAVLERRQQQISYQQILSEQQRLALEGEKKAKALEGERAALRKKLAGK